MKLVCITIFQILLWSFVTQDISMDKLAVIAIGLLCMSSSLGQDPDDAEAWKEYNTKFLNREEGMDSNERE